MSSDAMWIIVGVAATILSFLAIWRFDAITYIYDARPTEDGIDFCLFRIWRVYFLPYSEIESVDVKKAWGGGLFVYNFKNRFFRTAFLIRKRKGWFTKRILITPQSSEDFVRALENAHVQVKIE